MTRTAVVNTRGGTFRITEEDGAIVRLAWGGGNGGAETPVLCAASRWLVDYFDGRVRKVDFPVRAKGTPFQHAVWKRMSEIRPGEMMTYGDLARELGTSPRAVGNACGANPVAIIVPCHRVVGSDGSLGGYSGGKGLATKRALLDAEAALA